MRVMQRALARRLFVQLLSAALVLLATPLVRTSAAQTDTVAVAAAAPSVPPTALPSVLPAARPAAPADDSATLADSTQLIARLLAANGAPLDRAAAAAAAIVKYARLRALDPLLVVGIIGVENASLTPRARSRVGASGVMQVMPMWKRYIRDCGDDLRHVDVNICFGTRILRMALDETRTVREALLRYNGCVRAPGCHRYAAAVFSQAGRAVLMSRLETPPAGALVTTRGVLGVAAGTGL